MWQNKWNKNILEKCAICGKCETTKHMLFERKRVNNIWKNISSIINLTVQWKHIVTGLYNYKSNSIKIQFYNLLISMIVYAVLRENSHCKLSGLDYETVELKEVIELNVTFYSYIVCYKNENVSMKTMFSTFIRML